MPVPTDVKRKPLPVDRSLIERVEKGREVARRMEALEAMTLFVREQYIAAAQAKRDGLPAMCDAYKQEAQRRAAQSGMKVTHNYGAITVVWGR